MVAFRTQVHERAISLDFPTAADLVVSSVRQTSFGLSNFPILLTDDDDGTFCRFYASQTHIIVANFMLHFYRICFILLYAQYYCIGKIFPSWRASAAWFILQCMLGCTWSRHFAFGDSCHAILFYCRPFVLPTFLSYFELGWNSVSNRCWSSRFLCISYYVVSVCSEIVFYVGRACCRGSCLSCHTHLLRSRCYLKRIHVMIMSEQCFLLLDIVDNLSSLLNKD